MSRQKTAETREGLNVLRVAYWQSYLRDTQPLRGMAYQAQERSSWSRLLGGLADLKRRERALDLEDEHR
jgi:hypothetical protein